MEVEDMEVDKLNVEMFYDCPSKSLPRLLSSQDLIKTAQTDLESKLD